MRYHHKQSFQTVVSFWKIEKKNWLLQFFHTDDVLEKTHLFSLVWMWKLNPACWISSSWQANMYSATRRRGFKAMEHSPAVSQWSVVCEVRNPNTHANRVLFMTDMTFICALTIMTLNNGKIQVYHQWYLSIRHCITNCLQQQSHGGRAKATRLVNPHVKLTANTCNGT